MQELLRVFYTFSCEWISCEWFKFYFHWTPCTSNIAELFHQINFLDQLRWQMFYIKMNEAWSLRYDAIFLASCCSVNKWANITRIFSTLNAKSHFHSNIHGIWNVCYLERNGFPHSHAHVHKKGVKLFTKCL